MLNSLLEVVNFWNQTTQNVYFAINYTLVVLMAVAGLAALKTAEQVAALRGKSVEEIIG